MNWIQILGPTLLVMIGGIISWGVKQRTEELRAIEETLRGERRKTYAKMLEPLIKLFTDRSQKGQADVIKTISSYDYRKTAFELNLFGSDNVIRAYNELMQYTYKMADDSASKEPIKLLTLWGKFILEIRKSLGNKRSKLNEFDMLRGMITDIDKLKDANS